MRKYPNDFKSERSRKVCMRKRNRGQNVGLSFTNKTSDPTKDMTAEQLGFKTQSFINKALMSMAFMLKRSKV